MSSTDKNKRRNGKQWWVTIPVFTPIHVERLSNLSLEDGVLHCIFAIFHDHTGSRYLGGHIKTVNECHVPKLTGSMGQAFFKVIASTNLSNTTTEIKQNPSHMEFGDPTAATTSG